MGAMRPRPASVAGTALLLAMTGCSTHYVPQARGRISVVMDPGMGLYKDGRTYKAGLFGGDVDEAVAGNPRAEEEVAAYQSDQTIGTVLSFAGLAAVLGGAAVLGADVPNSSQTNALPPSLGLMLGGVVLELVSLGFTLSAQPHLWDAINIYNDGVDPSPRPPLVR
jgi:hypothetical protein